MRWMTGTKDIPLMHRIRGMSFVCYYRLRSVMQGLLIQPQA